LCNENFKQLIENSFNTNIEILQPSAADVNSASVQDRDGAITFFTQATQKAPTLRRFFADQAYTSKLQNHCFFENGMFIND
jgi:hypothetical protein